MFPGILKVTIPNNSWSGYGFVEFKNQAFLDQFLNLQAIKVLGYEISIKPISDGSKLQSLKEDYNNRRLFVRIRAKREVRPDLHSIFSHYGGIEKVQLLEESRILEKDQFTMIGFVLFLDPAVT